MDKLVLNRRFTSRFAPSLTEQVTKFLANAILDGELKGGQRLIEAELQRRFKTSRTPIRESFRVLEGKGLVVILKRGGTYVRRITKKDARENLPVRAYLEGLAARLAIPEIVPRALKEMTLAIVNMETAGKNSDFLSYTNYHSQFHEIFIRESRNDTLIGVLENLRRQPLWFRLSRFYLRDNYEYAIQIHKEILDTFLEKDIERAEKLVKTHILDALDAFLKYLDSDNVT
jgi:DNA-binding GntR family transcriptional regulator